ADRSVESLVADMERLFGKRYDRAALRERYGDLSENVMTATLLRGKAHEQVVAIGVLGEARRREAAPQLLRQLVHPYPILRYYALDALERIVGEKAPFDLHQDNARILDEARRWLARAGVRPIPQ